MNKDLKVEATIDIAADKADIWDTLTNPEKIKQYLFGTNTKSEWTKGSAIVFEGEYQGQTYRDKGEIIDIVPNERLQYSYWSGFSGMEDKPENYSIVTYQVNHSDGNHTLQLTQQGFASEQAQQHSQTAWANVLEQIKELAENN